MLAERGFVALHGEAQRISNRRETMKGRTVGIDLGTSNSVVSAVIDGEAVVIPDREGRTIQPSVVSFLPDGRTVVGRAAKSRMVIDPGNTIYSIKRLVGRPFYSTEAKMAASKYAYPIVKGDDDNPRVVVRNRQFSPEEVQAIILRHMKGIAEEYLGEPVSRAVITVPANFNEAQRRATRQAGQLAGLEVQRILNEPTAAALAYGFDQNRRERIAVYDFGGGTFDVTILELRDNVFEVLSTAGDTFLGGDDFDLAIVSIVVDQFRQRFQFDLTKDIAAMQRLKGLSERMKIELSTVGATSTPIKQLLPGATSPVEFEFGITREQFDSLTRDIIQRTFLVCDEALQLAKLTSAEVDRLVLVGGSTRVPAVREMVRHYFFKEPSLDINPDEVVAVGAAIYAHGIDEANAPAVNTGLPSIGGPIGGGAPGPYIAGATVSGSLAAIMGPPPTPGSALPGMSATLPGQPDPFADGPAPRRAAGMPLLVDVTPAALGIETVNGIMETVIGRNVSIPARMKRAFNTSRDFQDTVRINIYEGSARQVADNRKLGELLLSGVRPAPRGEVQVEVVFEINTDGMLQVTARDRSTGQIAQTRLNVAGVGDMGEMDNLIANLPAASN
jgi:molecular chaperone DnaK